jgi:NAD(P)-dependent dehydrogenase (short-subunit alcohol dehydrogenase family)
MLGRDISKRFAGIGVAVLLFAALGVGVAIFRFADRPQFPSSPPVPPSSCRGRITQLSVLNVLRIGRYGGVMPIGENALFVKHDISSEDGWKEVIARTEEKFGGVDILVNNAAILIAGTIEDTTLENWEKIQRVNSDGYFLGCKYGYAR